MQCLILYPPPQVPPSCILSPSLLTISKILDAMNQDSELPLTQLRVDGGMTVNKLMLQLQADLLGIPVGRPALTDRLTHTLPMSTLSAQCSKCLHSVYNNLISFLPVLHFSKGFHHGQLYICTYMYICHYTFHFPGHAMMVTLSLRPQFVLSLVR